MSLFPRKTMKSNLAKANSLEARGLTPLSVREHVDALRYEESLAILLRRLGITPANRSSSNRTGISIACPTI